MSESMKDAEIILRAAMGRAVQLEFETQLDGRMLISGRGVALGAKYIWKELSQKHGGTVGGLLMQHPLLTVIGVMGVAATKIVAMKNYEDYSRDSNNFVMAVTMLLSLSEDQVLQLNVSVTGGLQRTLTELFMVPVFKRLAALRSLMNEGDSDAQIKSRYEILEAGYREATELDAVLSSQLARLESQRAKELKDLEIKNEKFKREIDENLRKKKLQFEAGLITTEEYAAINFESSKQKLKSGVVGAGLSMSGGLKDHRLAGIDEPGISYFYDLFFQSKSEPENQKNGVGCFVFTVIAMMFIGLAVGLIVKAR